MKPGAACEAPGYGGRLARARPPKRALDDDALSPAAEEPAGPLTVEPRCKRLVQIQRGDKPGVIIVFECAGVPAVTLRVVQVRQAARDTGIRVFYTRHRSLPS
jgi:hypothetical protein